MKNQPVLRALFLILLVAVLFSACKDDSNDPSPADKPIIGAVVPLSGTKGTEVIITGAKFSTDQSLVEVMINGKNAYITSLSETQIKIIVPPKTGTGNIVVQVNGQATTGPVFNYIYTVSVSTYAGFTGISGYVDGDASIAQFHSPRGITIDQNDNLYVADDLNHCIRRVSPGGTVSTFAGNGMSGYADGDPNVARFNHPFDITLDQINGLFYVADKSNHCIRRITLSGYVTTAAGIAGTAGYVDAPGASARFNNPTGVTVEGELPKVYITDAGNHCIRKMDDLTIVTTFAGSSTPGNLDGGGTAAKFNYPSDIQYDSSGYLFVTDRDNNNIRRISLGGTVSTFAGNGGAGWLDGPGYTALFNQPMGIFAWKGDIIVGDHINNRIRKIDAGKNVITVAGNTMQGFGDGEGTQALFDGPSGVTRNSEGDYFVCDTGNHSIRKIVID